MDKRNLVLGIVIVAVIIALVFVLQWRAGNVIADIGQENFKLGDNLGGTLTLTLEKGDSLQKDTPILISLNKGDKVLSVSTITLNDFVQASDSPTSPTKKDNDFFYDTPHTYTLQINKVMSYKFNETGSYELFFNIFKIDMYVKRTIIVNP